MFKYKGYRGEAEFDIGSGLWVGRLTGIRDVVMFQAKHPNELERAFQESVDDYLAFCAETNAKPNIPPAYAESN